MTVTRRIDFLLLCSVMCVVVQAQQPVGYLGCFTDNGGDSLKNGIQIYYSIENTGELCKARCREHNNKYMYAGTKDVSCYCGSDIIQEWKRNDTECDRNCPQSSSEKCGGYSYVDGVGRISLYDTQPSESTIKTTVNFTVSPSKQAIRSSTLPSDQSVSAIKTTVNVKISPSKQAIRSSTLPSGQSVSAIKTTVNFTISPSTQNTASSTLPIQTSVNQLAIYIAIPVIIVFLLVVLGLTIFVIWRKKRNQKKDELNATNQTTTNTSPSLMATDNNVCNDRDIIPLENSANVIRIGRKKEKATTDRDIIPLENSANVIHIGSRIENVTIDESDNNYNTIARWRGLNMQTDVSVDANEYGHLNVRPAAFHDPTYSHTTGFQDSNDCTYSHMNQSAAKLSHVDHDTYSTCQMTGDTGKHMPAMKKESHVDHDTYSTCQMTGNTGKHKPAMKKESHVDHDTYSTCQMTGDTGKHRPAKKNENIDDTTHSV